LQAEFVHVAEINNQFALENAQLHTDLDEAIRAIEFPSLSAGNANAIAYNLEQGIDNGDISREALALWLRNIAKELTAFAAGTHQ
jgi:hypothetical protein